MEIVGKWSIGCEWPQIITCCTCFIQLGRLCACKVAWNIEDWNYHSCSEEHSQITMFTSRMYPKTGMDHLNNSMSRESKTIPVYAWPKAGEKWTDSVHLLDICISKLPLKAVEDDVFYVRPLAAVSSDHSAPWYSAVPVGKHTLNDKVKPQSSGNWSNANVWEWCARKKSSKSGLDTDLWKDCIHIWEVKFTATSSSVHNPLCPTNTLVPCHCIHYRRQSASSMDTQSLASTLSLSGVSLQNLHGCTINHAPPSAPTTNSAQFIDILIDKLLAEITNF